MGSEQCQVHSFILSDALAEARICFIVLFPNTIFLSSWILWKLMLAKNGFNSSDEDESLWKPEKSKES